MGQSDVTYDRELIAAFLEREIDTRGSWNAFAASSGVSRATLYRIREGNPRVTVAKMRQVEKALSLPFDTFQLVAVHDLGGLRELGLSGELVAWLARRIEGSPARGARSTSRTRSPRDT